MAQVTPWMNLITWDLDSDPYDHDELVRNWNAVDIHDHGGNGGAPLDPDAIPPLTSDHLGPCSVTSTAICDGAVIATKLGVCSVKTPAICDGAVTTAKIADLQITAPKLAPNSVREGKIEDDAVTAPKIADGAVGPQKIRDSAVNTNKIANQSVTNPKLASDSVDRRTIENHAVSTGQLDNEAVTQAKIAPESVGINELAIVPACFVTINSRQGIAKTPVNGANVWEKITWTSKRYELGDDNMFNLNDDHITIRKRGIYILEAGVFWEDGDRDSVGIRRTRLRKNGTIIAGAGPGKTFPESRGGQAPYRVSQTMQCVINCSPGDEIEVLAMQDSDRSQDILPDGLATHLSVTWIAPYTS